MGLMVWYGMVTNMMVGTIGITMGLSIKPSGAVYSHNASSQTNWFVLLHSFSPYYSITSPHSNPYYRSYLSLFIVLTSFNSDREIAEFAQAVTRARAQHAYTSAAAAVSPIAAATANTTPTVTARHVSHCFNEANMPSAI
jgi:hypothetical protein